MKIVVCNSRNLYIEIVKNNIFLTLIKSSLPDGTEATAAAPNPAYIFLNPPEAAKPA